MSSLSSRSSSPAQRVLISVAEPWDFESADGTNRLEARLVPGKPRAETSAGWVLEMEENLRAGGVAGRFLVMQPRHQEEPLEGLFAGKKVHVNLGLIPDGGEDWRTKLSDAVLVIVGTATLAGPVEEAPAL